MKLTFLIVLVLPAIALALSVPRSRVVSRPAPRPPPVPQPKPIEKKPRIIPDSVFTVVAPFTIRRGKSFNVYVKGFDLKGPVQLIIRIKGTSDSGNYVSIKKYADLSEENSKVSIKIDTSDITKGSYSLFVEGDNYSEKRDLTYVNKRYTFLVHFNKGIFQPGDLLQFRVFAVDSETKAVTPVGTNEIVITDPRRNNIKTFRDVTFKNGKYGNEFKLANKASTGTWTLRFNCDGESVEKSFEVAEYKLPLITGSLSVPQNTPFSMGKIPITVDVSYTSGGGASGTAKVNFLKNNAKVFTKNVKLVSGTVTFDVDIVKDLKVQTGQYTYFQVELIFEDDLSGEKVTDNKQIHISPNTYFFEIQPQIEFKPGAPFHFTIIMKKVTDNSPAPAGTEIKIIPTQPITIPQQTLKLGDDGTVSSSVDVPPNTFELAMRVTAKNTEDSFIGKYLPRFQPNGSPSFLTMNFLSKETKINQPEKIKFTVGEKVEFIMVHIVSKGVLLESAKLRFDDDSNEGSDPKTVIYTFTPTFKYAPMARVIAYYINKQGDFIVAQGGILLRNVLPNYLKINPKVNELKPGAAAEIDIESYVDSTVSLVAIDQRILLLNSESNFTKEQVIRDLYGYQSGSLNYNWKNVADYEETFGGSGLVVLTNIPKPTASRPRRRWIEDRFRSRPRASRVGSRGRDDVKIRQDFRETFLWRDVKIQNYLHNDGSNEDEYYNGIETISEKVPESITTYLIYGVSMSKYDGLGLSDNVPSVTVFLPFFLSVELPHSIKRNEVLVQDIFLFNYLKSSQTVEVKIAKDSKYEAVDIDNYGWRDSNGFYVKTIETTVGQNIKLQFALRPKILGFISFEVTAKGPIAGDGVKKQLRVIPEGIARSITNSVLIAIEDPSDKVEAVLKCDLPDSAYQDTTEISATVVGDLFGKALSNLDKLIHMPSGCGEQTMLSLAPDIAVYGYLRAAEKLTASLKTTLENYITAGVQNELRYQRNDGSFSAFGNRDPSGSTWLTAYVGMYFYFAKDMVSIDSSVVKKAATFILKQRNEDGSFKEPGRVIHSDMQGGSGKGIGLTAYCTNFLTSILDDYPDYAKARDNAIEFLEDRYDSISSTYELGIVAYALQLAGSKQASKAYDLFYDKKSSSDTFINWAMPAPAARGFWYDNRPRSLDIEITSYGLLTMIERNIDLGTVVKVVKYLMSKSNSLGGYSSSQDTVMALYALSQFAKTFSLKTRVDLQLKPHVGRKITPRIDSTNAMTVQSFDLNSSVRKLNVEASSSSSGLALVSLVCNFYEDPTKVIPTFEVTTKYTFSCTYRIEFDVCASYIPPGKSNMAIMTVSFPSGFSTSEWARYNNPDISQVEVINQGTTVIFYLNSILNKKTCISISAFRSKFVADLKNGNIAVTDYYDTSLEGMASLTVPNLTGPCYYVR